MSGRSDIGLAGERTSLAWSRVGLTLLGIPAAMLGYSAGRNWLAFAAAMLAACLGFCVLVISLRNERVAPGVIPHGVLPPATSQILLTGACVAALSLCGAILVFE